MSNPPWKPSEPESWAALDPKPKLPATAQFLQGIHEATIRPGFRNPTELETVKRMLSTLEKKGKLTTSGTKDDAHAILNMCHLQEWWIRTIETWVPNSKNTERQLLSLLQHLFAKYPKEIKGFWLSAFRKGTDRDRSLFLHIAEGKNIRDYSPLPLRIPLTKKMAHIFLTEEYGRNATEQIRYAQLKSMGIAGRQIAALVNHRTGTDSTPPSEEWKTVFYNIVALNPMLDAERIGEMLDYLNHESARHRRPDEKAFTMKGRTAESILRHSDAWHKQIRKIKSRSTTTWDHAGYKPYSFQRTREEHGVTVETGDLWEIEELVSLKDLSAEGTALRHCVSSYSQSCISRRVSIWSLRCNKCRCLTIEVRSEGTIAQIGGRCNRVATSNEMTHIKKWAEINNLDIRNSW